MMRPGIRSRRVDRRPGRPRPVPESRFLIGLDLGQASDFTAISITEAVEVPTGEPPRRVGDALFEDVTMHYLVRHLERPALGTPYPAIVARVGALMQAPELEGRASLIVDATGVGRAVVDMLADAGIGPLIRITIHGGDAVTRERNECRVPKRELAGTLQALLQSGRLKFAQRLPLADVLRRELQAFKVKINVATGHDTYEAWRENEHDDLVLSLAVACWYGENVPAIDYSLVFG